jgi:hypothetical protein
MLKKTYLDYDFTKILAADYSQHSGSCINHQVYEVADIHEQYGGFPESYCLQNTLIHQLWWDHTQLDFEEIGRQLGMEVVTASSIQQPPGCVIPLHRDTFYQINKLHPARTELKIRANIHLEDWKLGHFLQYNDVVHTHWRAGDALIWDSKVLHLGANAGMHNKYTLQISGFLKS